MSAAFRPCLLIPVYNHGSLIEATLSRLAPLALDCLLVDDGSNADTAATLDRLAAELPWVTLFRQQPNQGKGVAVLRGIREARALGYSHALQVDADGQHAVEDIPQMLAMAEQEPLALISGAPIYDESVPKSRLYGRYVTHFWVWIETLSFSVIDSMCGFRVYPVAATDDLAQSRPIGRRMDFDTDIMVRLYWRGVPVRFLKTRVLYPEDGISHFDLWQDNLRISGMHTRLVFGMLPRLPLLLWRKWFAKPHKLSGEGARHWSEIQENRAYLGMRFSVLCYRLFGRRALYGLLYPIIGYYFLANAKARRHSLAFLGHVYRFQQQQGLPASFAKAPGWRESFSHFMNFGRAIVDRLGAWSGDITRQSVNFPERSQLEACLESGQGAIILSSHLGNIEMCRGLVSGNRQVKMNVLVFNDNAAAINRIMKRLNPEVEMELIQISSVDPGTAMLLNEKLNRGELLVVAADRTSPTAPEKSVAAPFMGQSAYFPQGVFVLAGLLARPVYLMFCLREAAAYHIYFEKFADSLPVPRKQRQQLLGQYATTFAERLQSYALQAPEQWYNFFDFWAEPAAKAERLGSANIPSTRQ
ncbi:glycosyltransferase family 2 protein [Halioxenophilus sp. WMMB6]|uniref:glycosyltransferase family 2 protein n=1 Tax=Halioxenophilus sp. WMMB6 TaxID=3073815 RepID=UPI00295E326D|nr:glycosyltransferase [Halioxenophilus sp. WMMB6]